MTGRLTTQAEAILNTFILKIANDLYGGSEPWELRLVSAWNSVACGGDRGKA